MSPLTPVQISSPASFGPDLPSSYSPYLKAKRETLASLPESKKRKTLFRFFSDKAWGPKKIKKIKYWKTKIRKEKSKEKRDTLFFFYKHIPFFSWASACLFFSIFQPEMCLAVCLFFYDIRILTIVKIILTLSKWIRFIKKSLPFLCF